MTGINPKHPRLPGIFHKTHHRILFFFHGKRLHKTKKQRMLSLTSHLRRRFMRFSRNPDSKILQCLPRLCDLVIWYMVFLPTCLPVFTMGVANPALYATVSPMDTPKEGPLLRPYFQAFSENFRQSRGTELLFLIFLPHPFLNTGGLFGSIARLPSPLCCRSWCGCSAVPFHCKPSCAIQSWGQ